MAKAPLELAIKQYFDQSGAILVGMHQDLQRQQALVDEKLSEAERRVAGVLGQFGEQASQARSSLEAVRDEVVGLAGELRQAVQQQHCQVDTMLADAARDLTARVEKFIERTERAGDEVEARITSLANQVAARCEQAASDIGALETRLQDAMIGHQRRTSEALNAYLETNGRHLQLFEQSREEQRLMHEKLVTMLAEIDSKVEAHQTREAAFNRRVRRFLFGTVAAACLAALTLGLVWKP